jgi:hypothetical protein
MNNRDLIGLRAKRQVIEDFVQQLDKAIGEWPDKLQRTPLRVGLAREKEKYLKGLNAP